MRCSKHLACWPPPPPCSDTSLLARHPPFLPREAPTLAKSCAPANTKTTRASFEQGMDISPPNSVDGSKARSDLSIFTFSDPPVSHMPCWKISLARWTFPRSASIRPHACHRARWRLHASVPLCNLRFIGFRVWPSSYHSTRLSCPHRQRYVVDHRQRYVVDHRQRYVVDRRARHATYVGDHRSRPLESTWRCMQNTSGESTPT